MPPSLPARARKVSQASEAASLELAAAAARPKAALVISADSAGTMFFSARNSRRDVASASIHTVGFAGAT